MHMQILAQLSRMQRRKLPIHFRDVELRVELDIDILAVRHSPANSGSTLD